MQFFSLEPKKLLPEVSFEIWIAVGDNRVGHSMEFEDIFYETLRPILTDISDNEVHRYIGPYSRWNKERL